MMIDDWGDLGSVCGFAAGMAMSGLFADERPQPEPAVIPRSNSDFYDRHEGAAGSWAGSPPIAGAGQLRVPRTVTVYRTDSGTLLPIREMPSPEPKVLGFDDFRAGRMNHWALPLVKGSKFSWETLLSEGSKRRQITDQSEPVRRQVQAYFDALEAKVRARQIDDEEIDELSGSVRQQAVEAFEAGGSAWTLINYRIYRLHLAGLSFDLEGRAYRGHNWARPLLEG